MNEANGHEHETQTSMIQGEGFGIGLTVDDDNDPVVLAWVVYEGTPIGVSFDQASARRMAASVMAMADEAQEMEGRLREMTDDEVATEIRRIGEQMNRGE